MSGYRYCLSIFSREICRVSHVASAVISTANVSTLRAERLGTIGMRYFSVRHNAFGPESVQGLRQPRDGYHRTSVAQAMFLELAGPGCRCVDGTRITAGRTYAISHRQIPDADSRRTSHLTKVRRIAPGPLAVLLSPSPYSLLMAAPAVCVWLAVLLRPYSILNKSPSPASSPFSSSSPSPIRYVRLGLPPGLPF